MPSVIAWLLNLTYAAAIIFAATKGNLFSSTRTHSSSMAAAVEGSALVSRRRDVESTGKP